MKDPWIFFGLMGGLGFILGWAVPAYLVNHEIVMSPIVGGVGFFLLAIAAKQIVRRMKK
jgi:hypothetical protein